MAAGEQDTDQGWRLQADLRRAEDVAVPPHGLLARLRGPDVVRGARQAVASDVVMTHDGSTLFAYAFSEEALRRARDAIEAVLRQDEMTATMVISHWDSALDEWEQVDPPLAGDARSEREAARRSEETVQTRTLVALAGREVRGEFEETMTAWAQRLGIECRIEEHTNLLSTQVAFTVSGPARKLDEFAEGLRAEGTATMRVERGMMLSPL